MNKILNKLEYMDHHYEHHFVTNSDNIDHVKAKLDEKEDQSFSRIDQLEALVKKEVGVHLGNKMNTLESHLKSKMDQKIITLESRLDTILTTPEFKNKTKTISAGSWKFPFIFLAIMLVIGCGATYYFYQKLLRKMHLP